MKRSSGLSYVLRLNSPAQANLGPQVAKGHRVEPVSISPPFLFLPLPSSLPVSHLVKLKQEGVVPETLKGKGKMS